MTDFVKKHDRNHFYKYTVVNTAKLIVETEKLRYSSPTIFNDPFDVQAGMHYAFDMSKIEEIVYNAVEKVVLSDTDPVFNNRNKMSEAIEYMRGKRPTHGFPGNEIRKIAAPAIIEMGKKFEQARLQYIETWKSLVNRMRVLCLSESPDNVLMWSHYSDYHKGVVLRFKVAETAAEDDVLWTAEKVEYSKDPIALLSEEEFIQETLGFEKSKMRSLSRRLAIQKFDVWKYENEWRVWSIFDDGVARYTDMSFKLNKIDAVYFGCKCADPDIEQLKTLMTAKIPGIKFFKGKKHAYDYKLEFESM